MIIFDGLKLAEAKEQALADKVRVLSSKGVRLKIAAILFSEDAGSVLYTGLKQEAAARVGIAYKIHKFSLADDVNKVIEQINLLNQDESITGIIIQKPAKSVWQKYHNSEFNNWWQHLTSKIKLSKDVDGLHPDRILLPATVRAVLEIINSSQISLNNTKILILNRSDILGRPLYDYLKSKNLDVQIWGSKQLLASENKCQDFDIIITATGRANLITGEMIKKGVVLIDVGEPQADIDFASVQEKASFITPVPGGVGPMTVVSLLENCVELVASD